MSLTTTLLDKVWDETSSAMHKMFDFESLPKTEFMERYNCIHKYFDSHEYNENLLQASLHMPKPPTETNQNQKQNSNPPEPVKINDADIPGGNMYFRLKAFLRQRLEKVAANGDNLQGEDFLRFYAKTWGKYQFLCQVVNGLFRSLNITWVNRQVLSGSRTIHDVFTMAMKIWQDIFFKESNQSLIQTCLNLIKAERDGQLIDSSLIRQVVTSYVSAGFTEAEKTNKNNQKTFEALTTYRNYFEKQFLEETEHFYRLESAQFLQDNSMTDYLKKVTKRLEEEERRVQGCLHPTTAEKLKSAVEEILIKSQLDGIYAESKTMLREEQLEDLRILFKLVNRIPKANEPIQKDLEAYVYDIGMDMINRVSGTALRDPKIYVETIIDVYKRFADMIQKSFCNEPGYLTALDKACGKFINKNTVTQAAGKSTKSPELLARYCDALLRKGNRGADESDVEERICQIMTVFNYVEDKDVFQKFYGKMLAKRLVGQLSASDDYEASMISKLKAVCGFEYASKLERMFQDITVSTSLIVQYKTYCENKMLDDIVDFSIMVLTSNAWPFSAPPSFALPIELKRTFDSFTNFYTTKFTGRKLEWLYQHSKGEVQTLYIERKYTFQVSTYQMAILLLFNESASLTVERIRDKTNIEVDSFLQILFGLLKNKVLKCADINIDEADEDAKEPNIQNSYTIQINDGFKSKKIKINLNAPIKSVEQKEAENVNQSVEEDRKMLIQARIVRIMKARKALKHNILIQEVIPQLTSLFLPQIPMIKKCIDILIEKEFLERDSTEKDVYHYLA